MRSHLLAQEGVGSTNVHVGRIDDALPVLAEQAWVVVRICHLLDMLHVVRTENDAVHVRLQDGADIPLGRAKVILVAPA